jgi:hypothetical protein
MLLFNNTRRVPGTELMGYLIAICTLVIVAVSPLLVRIYVERFWIHGRGTVISLNVGNTPKPWEGEISVRKLIIEYQVAGRRFSSRVSYWRFFGKAKSLLGDEVKIIYSMQDPSRCILDSWIEPIVYTIVTGGVLLTAVLLNAH